MVNIVEYEANIFIISSVFTGTSLSHVINISPSNLSSLTVLFNQFFINFNFENTRSGLALETGSVNIIDKAI